MKRLHKIYNQSKWFFEQGINYQVGVSAVRVEGRFSEMSRQRNNMKIVYISILMLISTMVNRYPCGAQNIVESQTVILNDDSCKMRAKSIFLSYLEKINYVVETKNPNLFGIAQTIHRLENLTNVLSDSEGSYFGKLSPKKEDVIKWQAWFTIHKDSLCWDSPTQDIYICGTLPPSPTVLPADVWIEIESK